MAPDEEDDDDDEDGVVVGELPPVPVLPVLPPVPLPPLLVPPLQSVLPSKQSRNVPQGAKFLHIDRVHATGATPQGVITVIFQLIS